MMKEADRAPTRQVPACSDMTLDRTCGQQKGILPCRIVRSVSYSRRSDHALPNATIDVAFALNPGSDVGDVCHGRVRRGCLQRTQVVAHPATGVELQRCQTPNLPIARRRASRARVSRGCQLYTTPDMESRIVIRTSKGDTLTSKDYSSPRGANGYYVVNAKWSPDSQFFVYSMSSSGGHSPWSFPMMVYSRQKNRIAGFSDMINGAPTVSGGFHFAGPHTVGASTSQRARSLDDKGTVTVDLEEA